MAMKKSTASVIDPSRGAVLKRRKRNGPATKQAILDAALAAFCANGYDGVGLREIATAAGVTAVLANRYFGTKEALFSDVVDVAFGRDNPFGGDLSALAAGFAKMLVSKTRKPGDAHDALLLLLRSAANQRAAEILKKAIVKSFAAPLAAALPGKSAEVRAALFLAQIAGFQLMSQVIGLDALKTTGASALAKRLASMFEGQLLVDD
jgi:AcrR family transcriptional regulator